ncbi:MAG: hypothetical protein H0T73_03055, partial [Ardenticatenales bacterium]|nr:hypothetical protein [Ardenticatenales bacterium]
TYINQVPQANALDLNLGDIQPGESKVVTWQLTASAPGRFIELAADYKQLNYQQWDLTPLISEINTEFVHPTDPIFQGCERFDEPEENPQPTIDVTVIDADNALVQRLGLNPDGWAVPAPLTVTAEPLTI